MIYAGKVIADGTPDDVLDEKLIKVVYGVDVNVEDYQHGSRCHKICVPINGGVGKHW